jgi:carbamoyltransferase
MYVLGISAFYHDSAACIIDGEEIIAAAQEERFTRKKHDSAFPRHAVNYCIAEAGISPEDITAIVFYEKPLIKFDRLIETYLEFAPRGFKSFAASMPVWVGDKLFQKTKIKKELNGLLGNDVDWSKKLLFSQHHLSHAASAFFPSPFEEAAIITVDGVGEWTTTSISFGTGDTIQNLQEIRFPHSLGLLYSAFTYYTGFKVNSGEYKIMGLAPYGEPKYKQIILDNLIEVKEDGSYRLNMKYFDFATGLTMTNSKFDKLFGQLPRKPEAPLSQHEMDLAASIQAVTEDVILKIARQAKRLTGVKNVCLAGGVALNCVANGALYREKIFENIWIQPAAGDSGGALGAALVAKHLHFKKRRVVSGQLDDMKGAYLGPQYRQSEVEKSLNSLGASYTVLTEEDLIKTVAQHLADGKAVGWMSGRMEYGPRALGARSILADPRSEVMQKQLNLKIKFRESFRPFAPSVLAEHVASWFDHDAASQYMLFVSQVAQKRKKTVESDNKKKLIGLDKLNVARSSVPAITHVDFSARLQTVHRETNPKYHELVSEFYRLTGCPMLINTSFNVRGEPIVCSPNDAFNCFMGTGLDFLVIENCLLDKNEQDATLIKSYEYKYELD